MSFSCCPLFLFLDLFMTNLGTGIYFPPPESHFWGFFFFLSRSPVEKVKTQWESTQHGVELRRQQLEDMVVDSLRWDDHREETEELMRKYEARFYMLQQARRDPLSKQASDNQVRLLGYFLVVSFVGLTSFVLLTMFSHFLRHACWNVQGLNRKGFVILGRCLKTQRTETRVCMNGAIVSIYKGNLIHWLLWLILEIAFSYRISQDFHLNTSVVCKSGHK